jgi:hypothetical protein
MKLVQKLSLLAAILITSSCNEKVSPELLEGNTVDPTTIVPPSEYYFGVTNTSPAILNYNLHKTGEGNATTSCETRTTSDMSNDLGLPAEHDITCYFDAEELSMFHAGLKYKVQSSANTCAFIGYMPFSYFEQMPGDSSGSFTEIECVNDGTPQANILAEATKNGVSLVINGASPLSCGDIVTNDVDVADRVRFKPTSDEDYCHFNYDNGNNCDIGTITINKLSVNYVAANAAAATPEVTTSTFTSRQIKCGGKVGNCVDGPIKELASYKLGATRFTEIIQTETNKNFEKEYVLPPLIDKYRSNLRYANFRRHLASTNLLFGDSVNPEAIPYYLTFDDPDYAKIFNPNLMDKYSSNKDMSGNTLADPAPHSFPNNQYQAVPLAAEPFVGLSGAKVNPFYTFYCYDPAFDIKSRIRMVVRDWDRVFSTTPYNEHISDIWNYGAGDNRQDVPVGVEAPDDEDPYIPYNDLWDWDDLITMQEEGDGNTWHPKTSLIYPQGFFNPAYFAPNDKIRD